MGLTAEWELKLGDAGLIDFFDDNRPYFKATAIRAFRFAKLNVEQTGLPLRPDDAADSLLTALVISDPLRVYLAENRLGQQFWYKRFADLILDRLWKELEDEHAADDGS